MTRDYEKFTGLLGKQRKAICSLACVRISAVSGIVRRLARTTLPKATVPANGTVSAGHVFLTLDLGLTPNAQSRSPKEDPSLRHAEGKR